MPPIVEAKMMARITQQIMIMIFFCSSRQGEKKQVRNDITAECPKGRETELGLDMDEGVMGTGDGSGF